MSSAVIAENYSAAKLKEYICFVEQLGSNIGETLLHTNITKRGVLI